MKAALSRTAGGPETLSIEHLDDPLPAQDEVILDVRACGVNYPDVLIIQDIYQFKPQRPFAPGGEVAGVISAVGENVTDVAIGDRVISMVGWNGMATKVAAKASSCIPMPADMSFEDGAAFLMTFGTSYYALKERAQIQPGETLFVLGAAGGVGLAAVMLGKALGARVVGAVSSPDKAAFVQECGADACIVYPRGTFDGAGRKELAALFKAAAPERGFDVVFDAVGGDYAEAALRAIAWNGRLLVIGFPAGIPNVPLNLALLKGCSIVGVFFGSFREREPELDRRIVDELMGLYESGAIRPHISRSFPLEQAGNAIAHLAGRSAMGKVIVTIEA